MAISEVYEQYKHLDCLFTDPVWIGVTARGDTIRDLWAAIKVAAEDEVADKTHLR